jgi:4-hydroxy-3-methylbut-2-enyl diphosphate reductase
VGVTAGASAPEDLVNEVLAFLNPKHGVQEIRITREEEYFPPPRNIRQLQSGIETAALALLGATISSANTVDDRLVSASDVLTSLD